MITFVLPNEVKVLMSWRISVKRVHRYKNPRVRKRQSPTCYTLQSSKVYKWLTQTKLFRKNDENKQRAKHQKFGGMKQIKNDLQTVHT